MLRKNDIIEIEITAISSNGYGIGRFEGMAIFVPSAAIGDILEVKILKVNKKYAFAKIETIKLASKTRIETDCENSLKCGGCVYRHIAYDEEKRIKQQCVEDAIERIGGFKSIKIETIVGDLNINRYRNKAQIPIRKNNNGDLCAGFFAPHSHRIVPCDDCLLQPKLFSECVRLFMSWMKKYNVSPYDEKSHSGLIRHLYLRYAEMTDQLMVCIVSTKINIPNENQLVELLTSSIKSIKTIVINQNPDNTNVIMGKNCKTIFGCGYITDILCGLSFKISPLSFYQVNRSQTEKLYNIVKKHADLTINDVLIDLYCGTGTIGLSMASEVKKVIGVEIIQDAVNDAVQNAKLNNIKNAEFICSDAAKAALNLKKQKIEPDVVLVDPPRKGCSQSLINTIVDMTPKKVVYVSCNPATLARDLKIFYELGYSIVVVTPVDLFPRTEHVETVVLMSRENR